MKTNKDKLNEEDEERERQEKEKERERQEKEKDKDKDKDEKEKEKKSVFTEGSDEMDNTRLKVKENCLLTDFFFSDVYCIRIVLCCIRNDLNCITVVLNHFWIISMKLVDV